MTLLIFYFHYISLKNISFSNCSKEFNIIIKDFIRQVQNIEVMPIISSSLFKNVQYFMNIICTYFIRIKKYVLLYILFI
jgi:hypothetical protein